jgi:hypothetical protein
MAVRRVSLAVAAILGQLTGDQRATHINTSTAPGSGHTAVRRDDHVEYLVGGHLHHPQGEHCDHHGPLEVITPT